MFRTKTEGAGASHAQDNCAVARHLDICGRVGTQLECLRFSTQRVGGRACAFCETYALKGVARYVHAHAHGLCGEVCHDEQRLARAVAEEGVLAVAVITVGAVVIGRASSIR